MKTIYETESGTQIIRCWLQRGVGGRGVGLGVWDQQMQTVYLEWINNKVLLQQRNYIQSPVINHKENKYEKECVCVYMYITASLCCKTVINANTIIQPQFNKKKINNKIHKIIAPSKANLSFIYFCFYPQENNDFYTVLDNQKEQNRHPDVNPLASLFYTSFFGLI